MIRFAALAADYDGTLADEGKMISLVTAALRRFRAPGRSLILVTGRELDELLALLPEPLLFDRIVAENGGLLYWPEAKRERVLGQPPSELLIGSLRASGVAPLSVGRSIVATMTSFSAQVEKALADLGPGYEISLNKGSLMILPSGVDKGSGLRAALAELELEAEEVVGIGDGENDLPLFEACGYRMALENSVLALKQEADFVTHRPGGRGVVDALEWLERHG